MDHDDSRSKAEDSREDAKQANERRIEELLNINNRYVRTQRHLEQNEDIASPEQLQHASEIQNDREERMENLKNIIANDVQDPAGNIESLEKRIEYTGGYLEHNSERMDQSSFENAIEKQEHRKEQLENFHD